MDVHLHGACMGKLVGPAGSGGGGGGGTGPGVSAQFRILPNALPTECIRTDWERIQAVLHYPSLTLRVSTPAPHRTFSPEPLKISDEFIPSSSSSPVQDAASGFLLLDIPAGVRWPSLTSSSPAISGPLLEGGDIPAGPGAAGSGVFN